jgi:hypothetical protein
VLFRGVRAHLLARDGNKCTDGLPRCTRHGLPHIFPNERTHELSDCSTNDGADLDTDDSSADLGSDVFSDERTYELSDCGTNDGADCGTNDGADLDSSDSSADLRTHELSDCDTNVCADVSTQQNADVQTDGLTDAQRSLHDCRARREL